MFQRKPIALVICLLFAVLMMAGCNLLPTAKKVESVVARPELNLPAQDSLLAKHIPSQVLIKASSDVIGQIVKDFKGEITGKIDGLNVYRVNVDLTNGSLVDTLKAINKSYKVDYVEPVYVYEAFEIPTDAEYQSRQWGPKAMDLENALAVAPAKGAGVVIAIADTGVDYQHPEFDTRVLDGFNTITGEYGREFTLDYFGHGTHVSGIAAANIHAANIVGIAPQASILPVKVLSDDGYGSDYTIAYGIVWAVDNGADLINLSLGGKGYSQAMQDAVDYAVACEVPVIVSMGNSGKNEIMYPAGCSGVIAVGAIDGSLKPAKFTTMGRHMSVCAPGVDIYSALPYAGYASWNGTSMAAPYVTGAIALLLGEQPTLSVSEIKSRIETSTLDLDVPGFDEKTGYGMIHLPTLMTNMNVNTYGHLQVYVELGGMPMMDLDVLLQNEFGATVKNLRTNYCGVATFNNIKEGSYTVVVNIAGQIKQQSNVLVVAGSTEYVNFVEIIPTSIGGYVVDSRGGSGVADSTIVISGVNGTFTLISAADGSFFAEIPAGMYTVTASKPGHATYLQEFVDVVENRMVNLTLIEKPVFSPFYSLTPPSISVDGLIPYQTVSGVVMYTVNTSSENAIKEMQIRYGNFDAFPNDYASDVASNTFIMDTTFLPDGWNFVNICVYDVNYNLSEQTIPVMIQNGAIPVSLNPPTIYEACAITFGESIDLFRQERSELFAKMNKKEDVNILKFRDKEYSIASAPADSTIVVSLYWGTEWDAKGYRVYRSTSPNGPFAPIADVQSTFYNDASPVLAVGQEYYYKVTCLDGVNESPASETVFTIPLDKFNVSLETPVQGETFVPLMPNFTWSSTVLPGYIYYDYALYVMGVTDSSTVWDTWIWDNNSVVYSGAPLQPGKEYEWDIYGAIASTYYSDYSLAVSVSGMGYGSINGAFTFTTDPYAVAPVEVSLLEMDIYEPSGYYSIPFTTSVPGTFIFETSFYQQECDTVINLFDENWNYITSDDDGGMNAYSYVSSYLEAGTYNIEVYEYYGDELACHLSVRQLQ